MKKTIADTSDAEKEVQKPWLGQAVPPFFYSMLGATGLMWTRKEQSHHRCFYPIVFIFKIVKPRRLRNALLTTTKEQYNHYHVTESWVEWFVIGVVARVRPSLPAVFWREEASDIRLCCRGHSTDRLYG
jgi:hypothetical protein